MAVRRALNADAAGIDRRSRRIAPTGTLMSAADEDELTGRADDSSGSQRSPELLPQPPSSVLVPAMIPAPPKTPSRSVTPEPFVRAGPTRPGASPKVLDVDSVSMNGANLGVESVWMAEVTASSEEFSVDVSLSTGVTIVVSSLVAQRIPGRWPRTDHRPVMACTMACLPPARRSAPAHPAPPRHVGWLPPPPLKENLAPTQENSRPAHPTPPESTVRPRKAPPLLPPLCWPARAHSAEIPAPGSPHACRPLATQKTLCAANTPSPTSFPPSSSPRAPDPIFCQVPSAPSPLNPAPVRPRRASAPQTPFSGWCIEL